MRPSTVDCLTETHSISLGCHIVEELILMFMHCLYKVLRPRCSCLYLQTIHTRFFLQRHKLTGAMSIITISSILLGNYSWLKNLSSTRYGSIRLLIFLSVYQTRSLSIIKYSSFRHSTIIFHSFNRNKKMITSF